MSENEQTRLRRQKLSALREGGNAYPNEFRPNASAGILQEKYQEFGAEALKEEDISVSVAGRLMNFRKMGKVTFADFRDSTGAIQLFVRQQSVGSDRYELFQELDIGDIVGASGKVFRTRTGELSIAVDQYCLLAKGFASISRKISWAF